MRVIKMQAQQTSLVSIENAISRFVKAIALTGVAISPNSIEVRDWGCPHEPTKLPDGKMAVYIFRLGDDVLKIGKVGPNSNARFYTQHYFPKSSQSNLAKSLLADKAGPCFEISEGEIGKWMKQRLHRTDLLIDKNLPIGILNFLESFLQCLYQPKYEGFKSQRKFTRQYPHSTVPVLPH
ncbi:MAG: hypothetical protein ACREDS_02245 [Limisphaerales bacterium]